ncbi:hypothetical protein J2S78_003009 [Salibacterium salarium]|nr:hypothetical protein [Salibacterium salarium]
MDQILDGTRDVYVLTDSWYASTSLIDDIQERGWHVIGGLKSNRVLLNGRIHQPVKEWAQQKEDQTSCIVTVRDTSYRVHRYDGTLKGGLQGTVLACQPTNTAASESSVRYFFCTDSSLTAQKILHFYAERWNIKIFFRKRKKNFIWGITGCDPFLLSSGTCWYFNLPIHLLCSITSRDSLQDIGGLTRKSAVLSCFMFTRKPKRACPCSLLKKS